jgi:aminoglycoside 3-N-acetyltransferase
MLPLTADAIAAKIRSMGLSGHVLGIHSQLSSFGPVEPATLTPDEERLGVKPFAKTVLQGLMEGAGPKGTLLFPTHTNTTVEKGEYYHPARTPSRTGLLTETARLHPHAHRSLHPTHSLAALGPEAEYLVQGHTPLTQAVGLENGLTKTIGLDGFILFLGPVLKANTSFHAYETLVFPDLAPYFPTATAAEFEGLKRYFALSWYPYFHRNFYGEGRYESRAYQRMRQARLLFEDRLGETPLYYFKAKDTARFFVETVFPEEPDILFCNTPETCGETRECATLVAVMKHLYASPSGKWDSGKIRKRMTPAFLELLKPGIRRVK